MVYVSRAAVRRERSSVPPTTASGAGQRYHGSHVSWIGL